MLNISHIQHFSKDYGKGLRTVVFFKGCSLKCPWCCNPENVSFAPSFMKKKDSSEPEVFGRIHTEDEIFEEIIKNKPVYIESGGGVTFSGGECMLHTDAFLPLAKRLHKNGISLVIDTAGNVRYDEYKKVLPYVDEFLYDYKTASEGKFSRIIGGDLTLVTDNLRRLLNEGANVRIRIPLIPGFNTASGTIAHICDNLKHLNISDVDLLPFHCDAAKKYEALGLDYPYKNIPDLDGGELQHLVDEYEKHFNVTIDYQ